MSVCSGTSLYRTLPLTPPAAHKGAGEHGEAAKRLKTPSRKGQNVYIIFEKGGAECSFPPDWLNLTVIDVHPWQPGSQSAKSNRKSSEGA